MGEQPAYSEISAEEMRDLEAEFGRPLNREAAFWMIRLKTNRDAVERMIAHEEEERHPKQRVAA